MFKKPVFFAHHNAFRFYCTQFTNMKLRSSIAKTRHGRCFRNLSVYRKNIRKTRCFRNYQKNTLKTQRKNKQKTTTLEPYEISTISNLEFQNGKWLADLTWKPTYEFLGKSHKRTLVTWPKSQKENLLEIIDKYPHCITAKQIFNSIPTISEPAISEPLSPSQYPCSIISQRQSKQHCNELFSNAVDKSCSSKKSGFILYLDAEDGNTTSYLKDICTHHERLVVNMNPNVIHSIVDLKLSNVTLKSSTVNFCFATIPERSIVSCWLDYCGTLEGTIDGPCPKKRY